MKIIIYLFSLGAVHLMGSDFRIELPASENKKAIVQFKMTKVQLSCDKNNFYLDFRCEEPMTERIKTKIKNKDGIVFGDDSVELIFSPYGGWPAYRFSINSAGTLFDSFLGQPGWSSRFLQSSGSVDKKSWQAKLTVPFAVLENEELPPSKSTSGFKPRIWRLSSTWNIKLRRNRTASGKHERFEKAGTVVFAKNMLQPFNFVLKDINVEGPDINGKASISAVIVNYTGNPFIGKVKLMLTAGNTVNNLATIPLSCRPDQQTAVRIPFSVKKAGIRYRVDLEIVDENNGIVKISRDIPLKNPWVVF